MHILETAAWVLGGRAAVLTWVIPHPRAVLEAWLGRGGQDRSQLAAAWVLGVRAAGVLLGGRARAGLAAGPDHGG